MQDDNHKSCPINELPVLYLYNFMFTPLGVFTQCQCINRYRYRYIVQNKLTKLQECIHRSICINTSTQAQTPYLHTADKQTPNYTHHPRIQIFLSDHIGLPSQYSLPISAFLCSSISAGRSIIGHWGDYSRKPITAPGWI